ncbi:hypothetical protein HDU86_000358 [Geranomyces michiganensis]|nr:hypothetical protein HDU86_000358 [Geranomyces michiganensis]
MRVSWIMDEEFEYEYEDSVPVPPTAEKTTAGSIFENVNILTLIVMILGYTVSKYLLHKYLGPGPTTEDTPDEQPAPSPTAATKTAKAKKGDIGASTRVGGGFTPPATATVSLPAPRDESFTPEELRAYDGKNPDAPVYLAIKGIVFDVSTNRSAYAPGASYSVFAGRDASRALGKSSLKEADCVSNTDGMSEKELETLDQWLAFYKKRYPIVGKIA